MSEPAISINGTTLTTAQALTVRVALGSFALSLMPDDSLGSDEHGTFMVKAYLDRIKEISTIMASLPHKDVLA